MSRERQERRIRSEIDGPVVTVLKMVGIGVGVGGVCLLTLGVGLAMRPRRAPEPRRVALAAPVKKQWIAPATVPVPTTPPAVESAPRIDIPPPREMAVVLRPAPAARPIAIAQPVANQEAPKPMPHCPSARPFHMAPDTGPNPPRLEFDRSSEKQLADWLRANVREIDLDQVAGTSRKLFARATQTHLQQVKLNQPVSLRSAQEKVLLERINGRQDLSGLPLRLGTACQTSPEAAEQMSKYSREVRRHLGRASLARILNETPEAVPTLEQVLQGEEELTRLIIIESLARTTGPAASKALARRAVFELSPTVRQEAVTALNRRPKEEFRSILLQAFRHPWAPAAAHAAEALVALDDREAATDLDALLPLPDPCAPVRRQDGKMEAPQLVRVNHLRNCLLCHPGSFHDKDNVRGLIPTPGKPIPVAYYTAREGDFVRADVVYLRQDFSVMQPVENADPWPQLQRYDYVVRKRELSDDDVKQWTARNKRTSYPQRTAALIALRWLTEENLGQEIVDEAVMEWEKAIKDERSHKSETKPRP